MSAPDVTCGWRQHSKRALPESKKPRQAVYGHKGRSEAMEHMEFKENQTAAAYVADGLDENTQEAFELHMMRCPDCVEDVEVWRAIKLEMPAQTKRYGTVARQRGTHSFAIRRTAMIYLAAILLGAVVGWHSWDVHGTDLD